MRHTTTKDSGKIFRASISLLIGILFLAACAVTLEHLPPPHAHRLGLPTVPIPADNPVTPAKVELGQRLFRDTRLSSDGSVSCATCHIPEQAFADGRAVARGVDRREGTRNTPTLLNVAFVESQFWDGRRESLETQAADPFVGGVEHGLADHETLLCIVRSDRRYVAEFKKAFGVEADAIALAHVTKAIASFERTLIAGDSAFDRYFYAGDKNALSDAAVRGLALFRGMAGCSVCHTIDAHSATFTDQRFHRLGVGFERIQANLAQTVSRVVKMPTPERISRIATDPELSQLGRFIVTLQPADIARFKTPSLRNVGLTAPYMHDGSVTSLEEAVAFEVYYRGLEMNRPLILTPGEQADLVEFLKSLTSPAATQMLVR